MLNNANNYYDDKLAYTLGTDNDEDRSWGPTDVMSKNTRAVTLGPTNYFGLNRGTTGPATDYWIGKGGTFGTPQGTLAFSVPDAARSRMAWAVGRAPGCPNCAKMGMDRTGKIGIGTQ